jgi:hypothetical protein
MVYNQGMYIRFDPNNVVLPPILGGPQPHEPNPSPPKRKRQHNSTYDFTPNVHFPDFEKALQRASENELNYAAKSTVCLRSVGCVPILNLTPGVGNFKEELSSSGPSAKRLKIYHEPTPRDVNPSPSVLIVYLSLNPAGQMF